MFDLISIGDTVIDTFIPLEEAELLESKDEGILLGLRYGYKIPVGNAKSMVAGNAANCAVGSARLKLKTAIYTNVGNLDDDRDDDRIKGKFRGEGVDIRYVVETSLLPSNHNIVLSFKGERTILSHHQPWQFNLPDLDSTKWVYLTSLSPSYVDSNLIQQLINYLERSGAKLAYQPGTFQIKEGLKKSARLLSLCQFFIVNLEEARHLLGHTTTNNKMDIKKLLKGLLDLGPQNIVITAGQNGSYGFDGQKYWKLETMPADLVEMTGAGDAFATGTVAGLAYGNDLSAAMRWGAANGASVVEKIGPQEGLLTYHKMQEKLTENSKIMAKEF